jgi:hypothetical protein
MLFLLGRPRTAAAAEKTREAYNGPRGDATKRTAGLPRLHLSIRLKSLPKRTFVRLGLLTTEKPFAILETSRNKSKSKPETVFLF